MVFLKTFKTKKLRGYYIKVDDFAEYYASVPHSNLTQNQTQFKPTTYVLDNVQWISVDDILKLLDPNTYSDFYKKTNVYVFENNSKKSHKYFNYENLDLVSLVSAYG